MFSFSIAWAAGFPEPCIPSDSSVLASVYILHFTIFLYGFSYWIVEASAVVKLTDELGGNAETFGKLQSAFGVAQIISSIFFGWLVDRVGPKWILISMFIFGNALFNLFLAIADSITYLYVSRIPGVFMSAMLVASAMIAKLHAQACANWKAAKMIIAYTQGMPSSTGEAPDGAGIVSILIKPDRCSCCRIFLLFVVVCCSDWG